MATPEQAAQWIAIESDDYDGLNGSNGFGWARATTDEVAAGIGVSTEEAYRLLKAAARKRLAFQDTERRKGVTTKRYGSSQVGWAIWEVHLDRAQTREREGEDREPEPRTIAVHRDLVAGEIVRGEQVPGKVLLRAADFSGIDVELKLQRLLNKAGIWVRPSISNLSTATANEQAVALYREIQGMKPNASPLEWIKGSGVDRDGHSLTWWKNKATKWSRSIHDRPRVFIQVRCWDRTGAATREGWPEFDPGELKEAKAYAKEFMERTGGTTAVEGRVAIPYQSGVTIELGEWKNPASNGYYVWSVDRETQMPVTRSGSFVHLDEAIGTAKVKARAGSTYDEVVTFGGDPEASDFEIVKAFKAWSAEVHYSSDLPRIGGRLREHRR